MKICFANESASDVHYDEVLQAWGTTFYLRGKPVARYYASKS